MYFIIVEYSEWGFVKNQFFTMVFGHYSKKYYIAYLHQFPYCGPNETDSNYYFYN